MFKFANNECFLNNELYRAAANSDARADGKLNIHFH